jgi:hypothetical protein
MKSMRILCTIAFSLASTCALAQVPSSPGTSRDGAGPAAGAIQGGSIDDSKKSATAGSSAAPSATEKCRELSGTLREQCLSDLRTRGDGSAREDAKKSEVRKRPGG